MVAVPGQARAEWRGRTFATGEPVTFPFTHRKQPHVNYGGTFGQDVEPAGRYITVGHHGTPGEHMEPGNFRVRTIHGTARFDSPLVLEHRGYGPDGWKQRLSDAFGGKRGKPLSRALAKAGHDGIVTVSVGEVQSAGDVLEVVELGAVAPTKTRRARMIKVTVASDRMGGLKLTPSEAIQRQAIKHLREFGHEHAEGTTLIQSEEDAQLFAEQHLTKGQQRDLRDGWDVTITMDPWDYGHHVGYDFHEAIKA